jgi:hypothetical protein
MTAMPRPLLATLLGALLAFPCAGAGVALNQKYPEVVLKDGRVLKNVTFVASGTDTAMARWDGGMGTIRLDLIPDDVGAASKDARTPVAAQAPDAAPSAAFDSSKAPKAADLAEQSLAAEGGPALTSLKAIRFEGEVGQLAEGSPIVMTAAQPNFRRTEVLLPLGRYIEGYGPKGAWYATQKAGARPVSVKPPGRASVRKDDLEESFIEPLWRWRELNATLEVVGEELVTAQGSTTPMRTYVVAVTVPGGFRCDYLIPADDPKTPYLVKRTYQDGRIVGTQRRSRFRQIGALMLPTQYETDSGDGRLVEMRFFRVVLDPALDPDAFEAPPPADAKGGHL